MRRVRALIIALGIVLICNTEIQAEGPVHPKPPAQGEKNYSSPCEVFEVYRAALAKADKRTEFYCLTPESRDDQVLGVLMEYEIRVKTPKMAAVLRKHGVEPEDVGVEYCKRYKAKHGVDLQKALAEYEEKLLKASAEYDEKSGDKGGAGARPIPASVMQQVGPPPANQYDEQLFREIALENVADKVGLVVDMAEAIRRPRDNPIVIGELKELRVEGDKAVGRAISRIYHWHGGPGMKDRLEWNDIDGEVRFRKIKDGWFLENR